MTTILLMAGGTASGKSTLAHELNKRIHDSVLIQHDRYYKDIPHPKGYNFDEPDALDNALLAKHIALLKSGKSAFTPIYDFPTHMRTKEVEEIKPQKLIIIEGILVMSVPEIVQQSDITIFVDAPADIRLARRIRRDVVERGRDVEGVLEQYFSTVRPMHLLHIEPHKNKADLVINGTRPIDESIQKIRTHL